MDWIQPSLFWGLLGISIPLAIHLWNGKKGKVIAWAAMAWLQPQESQSSRSLKLDQILLLLLRILLWTLLVLFAVGIWWKNLDKTADETVHLIIPDEQVASEFRFELDQALENGESVFWLAEGLPSYEAGFRELPVFEGEKIQEYVDLLPKRLDSLHIYTSGNPRDLPSTLIWVPVFPQLHLAEEWTQTKIAQQVIALDSGSFLGLDERGILAKSFEKDPNHQVVFTGSIPYSLEIEEGEKSNIKAALAALTEVYGLSFAEVETGKAKLVFTDQIPENADNAKLYFLTSSLDTPGNKSMISLYHSVQLPADEVLEKGLLPELILSPLLEFFGIRAADPLLTQRQIAQKFIEIPKAQLSVFPNTSEIILVLIALVFALERFLAYRNDL
ncbi:BatA domain-containing protein [Algoriphagus sp. A40]|uniref:BatA domain-containing protein n=1 Tax=Algoriphagus sp. A40 TaxID=1945863 RepID=UPI00098496F2|nr:BatA domain-containing protein [Algoriphagus sp. A40]OOG72828.1 hypothetical protein B0E43_15330 [Algoriphagus sp. A40]